MTKAKGYASFSAQSPLAFHEFERRDLGESDVHIEINYCGICHSDIHTVRNEWGGAHYPLVPGHEIVGTVINVGRKVKKYQKGDIVGVGCMVNACGDCRSCDAHLEQFCPNVVFTYNSIDRDGTVTQGGYSNQVVVDEKFVLAVPKNLNLQAVAPLLCAGITTYSPLKHWGISNKQKVGVIGLGGLGHMAVKFAHAFGAEVFVFTTSPKKRDDALRMGATDTIFSNDTAAMTQHAQSFDFIIDTVSAPHDVNAYLALLKPEKTLCMVGVSPSPHAITSSALIWGRKNLSGSLIGGIAETQEMLDFCGQHNITCDVELIPINYVNEAYTRVLNSDVKYRFVIDMKSLP